MDIIARRIKAARGRSKLTQQALSDLMGFKDRQTIAAIEAGKRRVTAEELLRAMQLLGRDLDYFTDPFRLEGEGAFSWRTAAEKTALLEDFETQAGRWLALYREVAPKGTARTAPLRLDLTVRSSYEDAARAAEWLIREWKLGEIPATRLESAIRERLRALVLYVDAPDSISGAAVRLPEFSAILINRNESAGRRSFDLAHELFHILTWETIAPAHSEPAEHRAEEDGSGKKDRGEQLANCFASALLMPERATGKRRKDLRGETDAAWRRWLTATAAEFGVSVSALLWRLVELGMVEKKDVERLEGGARERRGSRELPPRFSPEFVKTLYDALEEGRISVRRVASLLDLSISGLEGLFTEHELEAPFDI